MEELNLKRGRIKAMTRTKKGLQTVTLVNKEGLVDCLMTTILIDTKRRKYIRRARNIMVKLTKPYRES